MAKDAYHETVKRALIKDGWRITHDPLLIRFKDLTVYADIGAEKLIVTNQTKIAVEIKVFGGESKISDFEKALGQYDLYQIYLKTLEPERQLFLAVSDSVHDRFFKRPAIDFVVREKRLNLLIFSLQNEVITRWINWENTAQS